MLEKDHKFLGQDGRVRQGRVITRFRTDTMLYLVGGAARSGKTIVSRRLLDECGIPCFSIDYLTSGLAKGAPQLEVQHELPSRERGQRLWPVLRGILQNIVEVEPRYVVEGDALLPVRVAELLEEYPDQIRACFLGYVRCSVYDKCRQIRAFPSRVNDWACDLSDEELQGLVSDMQNFSEYLAEDCTRFSIRYIETGNGFENALDIARAHLLGAT